MSVVASAKSRLVGEAGVLAPLFTGDLASVKVLYSEPTKDVPRELVYGGEVTGPVELSAMAGGARVKRSESLILQLHIRVWKPNNSREQADARAAAIAEVICNYVAANWTLGDLADLKKAVVSGVDLSGWTDDDGSGSLLTLAVSLTSYLT